MNDLDLRLMQLQRLRYDLIMLKAYGVTYAEIAYDATVSQAAISLMMNKQRYLPNAYEKVRAVVDVRLRDIGL